MKLLSKFWGLRPHLKCLGRAEPPSNHQAWQVMFQMYWVGLDQVRERPKASDLELKARLGMLRIRWFYTSLASELSIGRFVAPEALRIIRISRLIKQRGRSFSRRGSSSKDRKWSV